MEQPGPREDSTRDDILSLLSEGEAGRVSSAAPTTLRRGDEYLDLDRLQLGVQRADGVGVLGRVLSRKAIQEDTWRRVLRRLTASSQ